MDDSRRTPRPADSGAGGSTPVLDHLVGTHQGTRQAFSESSLRIGTASDAAVHFPADHPAVATNHATLIRQGAHYLLAAEPGRHVEVNGEPVTSRRLVDGDTIRIGEEGPVVRFRLYEEGRTPYKSIPEAFRDCVDCARFGSETWPGRAGLFLQAMPRELFMQTSPWSRAAILLLLALLLTTTGLLLSEAGHIAPLATRGIVGQATLDKLVYDAETTHGGSGGPVLGLNGEVQAINAAILTDFGGSNLGIPAAAARRLLDQAIARSAL